MVGKFCKDARLSHNISQEKLALDMGYNQGSYISHFEGGELNTLTTFLGYIEYISPLEWEKLQASIKAYFETIS